MKRPQPPRENRDDRGAQRLDRALAALRAARASEQALDAAASRVRHALNQELTMQAKTGPIAGCEGYQALIPDYLAGQLPAGRKLLFEDHSRGCVECRRALASARAEARGIAPVEAPSTTPAAPRVDRRLRWALAAALVLAAGLAGWQILGPSAALAQVESADGGLYRIDESAAVALEAGQPIAEGQVIRAGRSAGSVLTLSDGSRVEVAPRSELSLRRGGGDTTIQVARGDIIVEASEQGSGHLFVSTEDCLVSVTGTVFSVEHGTRGSRVSVLEGQVRLRQGAQEQVLEPGDQVSTDPGLGRVPFEEEIGWSRYSDAHLELLRSELTALGRELDALPRPAPRFGSELAGELPADSAIVLSLPNLSGTLAEAGELIEARVAESEVLSSWWQDHMQDSESETELRGLIDHLRAVGEPVGEEILISIGLDEDGDPSAPLLMGAIEDPAAFRATLEREAAAMTQELGEPLPLRFIEDPGQIEIPDEPANPVEGARPDDSESGAETESEDPGSEPGAADLTITEVEADDGLLVWIGTDRFAMSPDPAAMRRLAEPDRLAGSDFHAAIASAYAEGVEWMAAIDLKRVMDEAVAEADSDAQLTMVGSGLSAARYLVLRQSRQDGLTDSRAELSFDGPRQGMAGWLAEPAPMGALDFIAPEAHVAAAFVTRAPAEIFDEMLAMLERAEPGLRQEMEGVQQEVDLDLRARLAEPLGGEVAFALDGPLLPEPAWKLVVEVYDPAALQITIEDMVARSNEALAELPETAIEAGAEPDDLAELEDLPRLELSSETVRGRDWHALTETGSGLAMHYTFAEGYLVAGSSRAIVERALQYRSSGVNLRTAPAFGELLARGETLNVSGLMYQNLAPVAEPLGEFLAERAGADEEMAADEAAILQSAAAQADMPATLAWVSALPDRLIFSGRSDGGPLGMGLGTLLGLDALID